MHKEFLIKCGLTADQASAYSALLQFGPMPARKVSVNSGVKRSLAYKVLEQLIGLGLANKQEGAKVTIFTPSHPSNLKDLLRKKEEETKASEAALQGIMSQLTSSFNLISGKPNVQFFEGESGIKEVLLDSLTATAEIVSYADIESIQKFIPKINEWYVSEREKLGIKKRAISVDTSFNRKFLSDYHKEITDTRLMAAGTAKPFHTVMQIYDNKISYMTLSEKEMIGVIVEDSHISEMHKYIFEAAWSAAKPAVTQNGRQTS